MGNDILDYAEIEEECMAHYGVKGMHWGVWNAETLAKYRGRGLGGEKAKKLKKAVADRLYKTKRAVKDAPQRKKDKTEEHLQKSLEKSEKKAIRAQAREAKREAKKETAARDKELMRKYGLKRKDYEAIRARTLNSNDPSVVAKGMHLLSDEELNTKIDRLEREGRIRNLSTIKKTTEAKAKKEAAEARSKTLPYQLGKLAGETAIKTANDALLKPLVGDSYKRYSNVVKDAVNAERQRNESNAQNRETKPSDGQSESPFKATVIATDTITPNSSEAKTYEQRGKLLLEEVKKR